MGEPDAPSSPVRGVQSRKFAGGTVLLDAPQGTEFLAQSSIADNCVLGSKCRILSTDEERRFFVENSKAVNSASHRLRVYRIGCEKSKPPSQLNFGCDGSQQSVGAEVLKAMTELRPVLYCGNSTPSDRERATERRVGPVAGDEQDWDVAGDSGQYRI